MSGAKRVASRAYSLPDPTNSVRTSQPTLDDADVGVRGTAVRVAVATRGVAGPVAVTIVVGVAEAVDISLIAVAVTVREFALAGAGAVGIRVGDKGAAHAVNKRENPTITAGV